MRGATILKASDDKTRVLNTHTLMTFSGEAGDTGMADHGEADMAGRPGLTMMQCNSPNTSKPTSSSTR